MKYLNLIIFLSIISIVTACKKEPLTPSVNVKEKLMAHTWQIDEIAVAFNGISSTIYKKGGSNNQQDFSAVRQTFNPDGTITYIDEAGNSVNDDLWELQDNDTKIKLTLDETDTIIGEELVVTDSQFSYKAVHNASMSIRYKLLPSP